MISVTLNRILPNILSIFFLLALPSSSEAENEYNIVDPSTVNWEVQIPWTGKLLETDLIQLSATGDTGCFLNYEQPPYRLHCSLELTLGLPHFEDSVTRVEAGVKFEGEDLADIANNPTMTFYFGFTSPELALDIAGESATLVESQHFPENGGYYEKTVELPGFERGFCVLDFAEKIPEEVVQIVVESATWSGTDVCVSGKFDKLDFDTVNVALNVQLIALDDERIPWDKESGFPELAYEVVGKLINRECENFNDESMCEGNDCMWSDSKCSGPQTNQEIFKYVRKKATGSETRFEKDMNIGVDVLKLLEELEDAYEEGTEQWEKWKRSHQNAQMLVNEDSGAFEMGDQSSGLSTGYIIIIVMSCISFVALCGLALVYKEQIYRWFAKGDNSDYQTMGVNGIINKYERLEGSRTDGRLLLND